MWVKVRDSVSVGVKVMIGVGVRVEGKNDEIDIRLNDGFR